jgi:glutamate-5-semialdehyde dehydrogenase
MDNREYIEDICSRARKASRTVALLSTNQRNGILRRMAERIRERADFIIGENGKDLLAAKEAGVTSAFYDRLLLDRERLEGMAGSIEEIAALDDPVGRVENMKVRPSGIRVGQMRVPIGVVAVIYESRPNVTTDIAALCLKSGNAAVLRGGRESFQSNMALHAVIREALKESGCPEDAVALVSKTDHDLVTILLKMNQYVDIVIPRGGEALIRMVTKESTIPVIKHDKGVCHTYIDPSAEDEAAVRICVNAKVQRPGVCNAMETLLIHSDYPRKEALLAALLEKKVELRGCGRTVKLMPDRIRPAAEEDWHAEYLDLILAVRIVDSMDEAVDHIARYGSGHSEAIVTNSYANAERFLKEVDSAAVFVNASTRFHDGGEFGLGAEVGISTQKLHARGTMGIEGLTCLKYIIYGNGQVRS